MAPAPVVQKVVDMFESTSVLDEATRSEIGRNGLALFPRFEAVTV
jgi:hypothetical protein